MAIEDQITASEPGHFLKEMIGWWKGTSSRRKIFWIGVIALTIMSILSFIPYNGLGPFDPVTGTRAKSVSLKYPLSSIVIEPFLALSNLVLTSPDMKSTALPTLIFIMFSTGLLVLVLSPCEGRSKKKAAKKFLAGTFASLGLFFAYFLFIVYVKPVPWRFVSSSNDVLIGDFKSATTLSHDGVITPKDNLSHHGKMGFDFVVTTSHDNFNSVIIENMSLENEAFPVAIPGVEIHVQNVSREGARYKNFYLIIAGLKSGKKYPTKIYSGNLDGIIRYSHREHGAIVIGKPHKMVPASIPDYCASGLDAIEYIIDDEKFVNDDVRRNVMATAARMCLPLVNSSNWHGWTGTLCCGTAVRVPGAKTIPRKNISEAVLNVIREKRTDNIEPFVVGGFGKPGKLEAASWPVYSMFRYYTGLPFVKLLSYWLWWGLFLALCPLLSKKRTRLPTFYASVFLLLTSVPVIYFSVRLWAPSAISYPYFNHVAGGGIFLGLVIVTVGAFLLYHSYPPVALKRKRETDDLSPALPQNRSKIVRDLVIWVFIPTLFRLMWINTFGLCSDEAYYWEWSRRLALGYHDQGPGVAIAIRIGTWLFGDTIFGVRFMASILFGGAVTFAYFLALDLYGRKTAFWTALLFNIIPIFSLAGILMTYDTPQAFFWCAGLYTFSRAVRLKERMDDSASAAPGAMGWWLLTGLSVGLGFDCKFTAVLFIPAAFLYLVWNRPERSWLKKPHPYLMGLIALLAVYPVLYWNYHNDWRSVQHIVRLGKKAKHIINPGYFFEFLGGQAGVISPIIFGFIIWKSIDAWKRMKREKSRVDAFMVIFFVVYVGLFFLYSWRKRVYANWPGIGYATGVILVAAWYTRQRESTRSKKWFSYGLVFSLLLTVVLHLHLATGCLPIRPRHDPLVRQRFAGMAGLAKYMDNLQSEKENAPGGRKTYIYAKNYQLSALMAFYLPGKPMDVMEVKHADRPNQYDLWGDIEPSADALLLVPERERVPEIVYQTFDTIQEQEAFLVRVRKKTADRIKIYYCRNYRPLPK